MREYGEIPAVLDREETFVEALERNPNVLEEDEPSRWQGIRCPNDFVSRAEAILPSTQKTATFVCCGNQGSHRIELWIEDGLPDLLGIKLDLRKPDIDLFERVTEYAKYLDAFIVPDDRFTAVAPSMHDLIADLRLSRAYKFCEDPQGCIAEIAAQNQARTDMRIERKG